jgi:hypothetical protein
MKLTEAPPSTQIEENMREGRDIWRACTTSNRGIAAMM